jgi:predicted nucleic acid-binding protein
MPTRANLLVVDAFVAAKWRLPEDDEEHADLALGLLDQFQAGTLALIAPRHVRYEVVSAITVATLGARPRLTVRQAQIAIDGFLSLPLPTFDDAPLLSAGFLLARQYGIAFYDAVYLALAQREQARLITADRKCYNRILNLPDVLLAW